MARYRRQELQEATLPFRGGKIRFENNSSSTTKESGRALDTVLAEMNRDRQLRVLVKAYADSTEGRPDELSKRRAGVIVHWLVSRGIDRRRLAPLDVDPRGLRGTATQTNIERLTDGRN